MFRKAERQKRVLINTKETVRTLKNNGIDFQVYDLGINNFKDLDRNFIKRINIPCEMTGKEIIDEIENV